MSMTTYARDDRPVREPEDPRRAAMARRSLSRWALRLAVREWKQRILIILLIAVASAATLLGAAAGVLAVLGWARADLTMVFGNVPWSDIGLLVIGMPLIGAAAGWLIGGRQPSAVSRQPLQ
jgi:hypothetical protein